MPPRRLLIAAEKRLRENQANPEWRQNYEEWVRARNAWIAQMPPLAPAAERQQAYESARDAATARANQE
jgi:hypothetical protein